jgi:rod shape-determining protein MreC
VSYFRRFRDAAISVALLIIPFLFLSANLSEPDDTSVIDQAFLQLSAPVQYLASETANAVSGVVEEYVYLVDVKRDNERLRLDAARLEEENRLLRMEARENQRLRDLLALRERLRGDTIAARVIGKEISPYFRVVRLRLDRGARDRVRAGMPVVSAQGLVGQVRRTFGRHADVRLTVDRESAVDVIVQRTGARGVLRGTGETDRYAARIQYLQRDDEIEVGDEVYTSGLGRRFPAAILVGRVSRVERAEFGLYQEVEVRPTVDFSALEEVLVLTEGARDTSRDETSGSSREEP